MKKRDAVAVLGGSIREVAQILAAGILRMDRNATDPSKNDAVAAIRKTGKGGEK